jgi:hypothetical protein
MIFFSLQKILRIKRNPGLYYMNKITTEKPLTSMGKNWVAFPGATNLNIMLFTLVNALHLSYLPAGLNQQKIRNVGSVWRMKRRPSM